MDMHPQSCVYTDEKTLDTCCCPLNYEELFYCINQHLGTGHSDCIRQQIGNILNYTILKTTHTHTGFEVHIDAF